MIFPEKDFLRLDATRLAMKYSRLMREFFNELMSELMRQCDNASMRQYFLMG